jgi:hypothetical protein
MDVDLRSPPSRLVGLLAACVALVLGLVLVAVAPGRAGASIEIHNSDATSLLGQIEKGKCSIEGRRDKVFGARGKSTDGAFELFVSVNQWRGFRSTYPLFFGAEQPANFALTGPGGPYSNLNPIPGTPPGVVGGGAIAFEKKGKLMSLGFVPAPNQDFSQAVTITGAMKCKYPKKKK